MGAEFWILQDQNNNTALMKNGKPFVYTTEWTARLGAKFLGRKRRLRYRLVPRFTGAIVK